MSFGRNANTRAPHIARRTFFFSDEKQNRSPDERIAEGAF
jgi:hypothetical protein